MGVSDVTSVAAWRRRRQGPLATSAMGAKSFTVSYGGDLSARASGGEGRRIEQQGCSRLAARRVFTAHHAVLLLENHGDRRSRGYLAAANLIGPD